MDSDDEKFNLISSWVTQNFAYDYVRSFEEDEKPFAGVDADYAFTKHMGICCDLAGMGVAMLRSQGIPSVMVVGCADNHWHSWVRYKIGNDFYIWDPALQITGGSVKSYVSAYEY